MGDHIFNLMDVMRPAKTNRKILILISHAPMNEFMPSSQHGKDFQISQERCFILLARIDVSASAGRGEAIGFAGMKV